MTGRDEASVPLSVYAPPPAVARAATLYVCTRLDVPDARTVLQALGLIATPETPKPVRRTTFGRADTEPTVTP